MAPKFTPFNIYAIDDNDEPKLAASVDHAKLAFFSDLAAAQPKEHTTPESSRSLRNSITFGKGVADGKAIARIGTWMETNSIKDPQQLTLASLNIEYFDDVVLTYAATYVLRLKRELRGDDVRNAIHSYIHQGNLTCDEFVAIVEWLAFDRGLVKTAVHQTMFRACKGGMFVPKEMGLIEEYAKEVGMWEEMQKVGEEIWVKMEERDHRVAKAARQVL
ncbi:hypothetical protein LTR48_006316 [Friedmanniomyces endolithicus]|uniref:BTB domain-containing protein n=1 Tax=Rachicladosporium monterosium TaxID=1507873 RepID=A0ABR0KZD7_9PEZI|nr:hypothetical protein LTS02_007728 [Friedmanniomyces endolithicus]KAK0885642.1 hypothetical protein LTR87_000837 [Friedmanniomyces endolithicus]KAK0936499.1 hypothetical protein LTR29_011903 [Friedmanniomyces endolithicus]KAK1091432.1 hypothetical protein LTR48_006316 [Friedmanniomyces endolithicus]KAK5141070.1 hypothetical protein LTR32_006286 [Rachicladosporium monterosium]